MRRELVIENINFVSFLFLSLLIFVYDLKIKQLFVGVGSFDFYCANETMGKILVNLKGEKN